jgi:hypothetical protein
MHEPSSDPAEMPVHPDRADTAREPTTARQRWPLVGLIIIVAVAVLLLIALHVSGVVGPGTH